MKCVKFRKYYLHIWSIMICICTFFCLCQNKSWFYPVTLCKLQYASTGMLTRRHELHTLYTLHYRCLGTWDYIMYTVWIRCFSERIVDRVHAEEKCLRDFQVMIQPCSLCPCWWDRSREAQGSSLYQSWVKFIYAGNRPVLAIDCEVNKEVFYWTNLNISKIMVAHYIW